MRLHSLTLRGLGPFRGTQHVDFDSVSASGLFLIEGPTGAGKTTIIDAVVFALYGSLSGADSDPGRLRSQLCAPDEPTEVSLDFSVGGVRHTITRNPAYQRPKARGEGTTLARAAQTLVVHDGHTPDMREAKEIAVYLAQRIGLTVDQFRRLVILPQGEFDALLQAKPRERYETVAALIDDGFLQRVQEELKRQADEAVLRQRDAGAEVERILGVMRARIAEVEDVAEDVDPAIALERIAMLAAQAATESADTATVLAARRADEHEARTRATAARDARAARAQLVQAQSALAVDDAELDSDGLQARAHELVARRTILEPIAEWEGAAAERAAESARLHKQADDVAEQLAQARADHASLPQRRQDAEAALGEARIAADRISSLEADLERWQSRQADITALDDLQREARDIDTQLQAASQALQAARDQLHQARTRLHALVQSQLDQRAAHLAARLLPGQACPVCGSAEHPTPAHDDGGTLVSDTDVSDADAEVSTAEVSEATALTAYDAARARQASVDQRQAAIAARLEGVTADEITAALAATRRSRDEARAAADTVDTLATEVASLAAQATTATTIIEGLLAQEASERAKARAYDVAVEEEATRHRAVIADDDSAAAALEILGVRLSAIEAVQRAHTAIAAHPVDADPEAAEAARVLAEAARAEAEALHATADEHRVRLAAAQSALVDHAAELAAARSHLEAVGQSTATAIELGALVTAARGSANLRNLTLGSYAVQRRFRTVLDAASVHLERMSSGKFSFALDETASGGAQAGLGIDIIDSWTGDSRDPGTLSGGERFYASLSLALGLADVVQAESGGIALDTLFVDEGFGSLDAETLTVVLDQLDALRSRGRVVGVISHVTEMKEWVHDRIVVEPGAPGEGSRIHQPA